MLALLSAMLLWASSFIALKLAFRSYAPMFVIFGRMALASMCFLFLIKRLTVRSFQRSDLKYLLFLAGCEPCLYFIFEAKALELTTASQAGMVTAMLPLMVGLSAHVLLKERVKVKTYAGFLLAICGVVLLSAGAHATETSPNPVLGNFLEFLAMACATGYSICMKHLSPRYSPLFITAFQAFVGGIFFLPLALGDPVNLPRVFDPAAALSIVYLGIFVSLGAYGLFNFAVSRLPVSQAGAYVNLIPVFTVILGWLLLGERFTPVQYAACALVFMGVMLSQDRQAVQELPGVQ
ncbi:MAG: DMT family transporter [Syntrophaceae bacterium]